MKKLLFIILATLTLAGVASAATPLSPAYKAVYCYPTGSYWIKQLSNPWNAAYYATHPYYSVTFGAGSRYC